MAASSAHCRRQGLDFRSGDQVEVVAENRQTNRCNNLHNLGIAVPHIAQHGHFAASQVSAPLNQREREVQRGANLGNPLAIPRLELSFSLSRL